MYELTRVLGEGAFAVVKLATRTDTGEQFACKLVSKLHTRLNGLKAEVEILTAAGRHQNMVSLVDEFDASDEAWALLFDLVTGGEVFDKICEVGHYSEREAAAVIRQVSLALQHLHTRNIVHRDLKPENLLLVSPERESDVKLCDFGLARFVDPAHPRSLVGRSGTLMYFAPEVVEGRSYGKEVDLWALGVLLYILLGGNNPFDPACDSPNDVIEKRIRSCRYDFEEPEWVEVSSEAKHVIRRLLVKDPDERATVDELLRNAWVMGDAARATPLPDTTASKMREFNDARRTWRAAIRAVTLIGRAPNMAVPPPRGGETSSANLSGEALDELKDAFKVYDTDGSGSIDLNELRALMKSLGAAESEAERTLMAADTSHDGVITFDEFCAAVGPVYESSTKALRRAFDIFDEDRNGSIDRKELRHVLTRLHLLPADASPAVFEQLWNMADTDHDERITFDEFVALFRKGDVTRVANEHSSF